MEENGWTCSHTVVEVVTDDMPFLVDSVTNELSRQDRAIHVVVHPQMLVRRDVTGKLLEVLDAAPGDGAGVPHDVLTESWIHVEIDRETDREDLKQITTDLRRVLSDVRETVEDWQKMRDAALRIADELAATPPALPEQEVGEAWELLRWLSEDHFTFLGYREYALTTETTPEGEEDVLTAVPGTGLGILRSDPQHRVEESESGQAVSPSFNRLPADARKKAREHKLLILTKANSRSTVHRPSYLDYIGVKKFDADGNVVGERRFLGLFSSAAYTESVRRVPVIRRKVQEVLDGAGFSRTATTAATCCRSWRPTRATSSSRPARTSCARSSPACCTCRNAAGCGCSCARTSTAATSRRWSTCPGTATPRACGCG